MKMRFWSSGNLAMRTQPLRVVIGALVVSGALVASGMVVIQQLLKL